MNRLHDFVSRGYRYGRDLGYATALASAPRRVRSHMRLAQLHLIRRWSPVIAVDTKGLRIFIDTSDVGVARQIVLHGAYEADTILSAVALLEHIDEHPFAGGDRTFVDVGANIGTAILQAVRHHGAAGGFAYEPHPENIALLRQNLLANEIADRVSVVHCAVTDSCRPVSLERSPNNSGDHRVRTDVPRVDWFGEALRDVMTVPGLTLDSQVEAGIVDLDRVGLVSMDTQGHEAQVLAGARRLCASEVPIMLEYWPYGLRAAGGHEQLLDLVANSFKRFVDLAAPFQSGKLHSRPAAELGSLDADLGEIGWADVLLLSS